MKINKKAVVPIGVAIIVAIVLASALGSPGQETPTPEPDLIASFVNEWNALAEDSPADLNLNIAVSRLRLVADGDRATTYEFRFWDGASRGEYHKISLSLAKEGNPHRKAGTLSASVESNRAPDTERLMASWGLLIATMLPGGTLADASDILRELGVIGPDVNLENIWRETTREGFRFGFEGFQSFFLMYGYEL